MTETKPSIAKYLWILIGIFLALMGIALLASNPIAGIIIGGFGALLAWGGFKIKPIYSVVTVNAGGTVQALSSKDFNLINDIVNAINEAIVHRG